MTDESLKQASTLRNRITELKMLLDKDRTPSLVRTADMANEVSMFNQRRVDEQVHILPETKEKIELLVREDLELQLRTAQETFAAL